MWAGDLLLNTLVVRCRAWCLSMLALVMAAPLLAQPDNDQFANRFPLSGDDVSVEGTVLDASREPGEETANGAGFWEVSVWWSWRAPRDGYIRVSASGIGGPTVRRLSVFDGTTLPALILAGSADLPTEKLEVVVPVQAGRSYAIAAIDRYGSASFFNLRLLSLPPGDIVPILLEGDALALEGTTLNATP